MLKFEYCECGCRGFYSGVGSRGGHWIHWDLGTNFYLHRGHGWMGTLIKKCATMEEAMQIATDEVKAEIVKMQAAIS